MNTKSREHKVISVHFFASLSLCSLALRLPFTACELLLRARLRLLEISELAHAGLLNSLNKQDAKAAKRPNSSLREWLFSGTIRMEENGLVRNETGEVFGATVEHPDGTFHTTIAFDESGQVLIEGQALRQQAMGTRHCCQVGE